MFYGKSAPAGQKKSLLERIVIILIINQSLRAVGIVARALSRVLQVFA